MKPKREFCDYGELHFPYFWGLKWKRKEENNCWNLLLDFFSFSWCALLPASGAGSWSPIFFMSVNKLSLLWVSFLNILGFK